MKTWIWVVGGIGAAVGGLIWWKGRESAPVKSFYPEGVIPGTTPGYPLAPSADQLPPDTEGAAMAAQGSSANASSAAFLEPSNQSAAQNTSASRVSQPTMGGASTGSAAGTTTTTAKAYPIVPLRVTTPKTVSEATKMTAMVPMEPAIVPQKASVVAATYKSPVTSKTTSVAVPVATIKPVSVPTTKIVAPVLTTSTKSISPMTRTTVIKPATVLKPTALRGVYAIGADHTEAEYRALAARAQLESKRREWAANQMAEQIAAVRRSY